MITRTVAIRQTPAWQTALAQAISDPAELLRRLQLDTGLLPAAHAAARLFPLRVPLSYLQRMRPGDAADPLLLQVLPLHAELEAHNGYSLDPVGDRAATAQPGVIHKYHGRVLLTATGACAVHCRYCFRRHFAYADNNASSEHWAAALRYIAADVGIREVILSGGDPLTLSDAKLAEFAHALAGIAHVERLRIHTRLPIVLPSRVDAALCAWLAATRLQLSVVVHANHANELDGEVACALQALRTAGVTVLNQSVLLRGINDSVERLVDLSEALFRAGALPYYLHVLDKVAGAAHFDIPLADAQALHAAMRARLPGYLVPRLVREDAGAAAKTILA